MAAKRVLHLSDLHLTASGVDEDGVDARAALVRLLGDLRFVEALDLVVVSGDVTDDGSIGGYRMAAELVGGFARDRGVPVVHCTGNHDDRANFAAVLGTGHRSAGGDDVGEPAAPGDTCAAVSEHDGLRVVTLDSLVPGAPHGVLGPEQLTWLGRVLADPAPLGTLVVLHHPPIAAPGVAAHGDVLADPAALAAAIGGTDVRAVLCGHLHHQMSGTLAGVPVAVTPGVVTRVDTTAPAHLMRAVLGAGATLVDLVDDAAPIFRTVQARDPRAGEQVYLADADAVTFADVADEAVRGRR